MCSPCSASPLVFEQVTLQRDGRPMLGGVDFAVNAGEIACLPGVRCAGTAALLQLAAGNVAPSTGEVRICGLPPDYWPAPELARHVRVLAPRASLIIGATGAELLAGTAVSDASENLVRRALERAGITEPRDCNWNALCGEESRCVHAASLLVRLWSMPDDVRLVIVDGCLDGLPSSLALTALSALREFAMERGAGVLATLENIELAGDHADRMLMIHHGHPGGAHHASVMH